LSLSAGVRGEGFLVNSVAVSLKFKIDFRLLMASAVGRRFAMRRLRSCLSLSGARGEGFIYSAKPAARHLASYIFVGVCRRQSVLRFRSLNTDRGLRQ